MNSSHHILHVRSVLKRSCIHCTAIYYVSILNRFIKCWKTFTAKWAVQKMTDPEGNELLFDFGLSQWSQYTHIPAAMLWLPRLSSNGLLFAFGAFSHFLYHPVNSCAHFVRASREQTRLLLLSLRWPLPCFRITCVHRVKHISTFK